MNKDKILLTRDVNVIAVPDGNTVTLQKDDCISIFQEKGNNFTIQNSFGLMFRLDGCDADAIGYNTIKSKSKINVIDKKSLESNIWEVLKEIYDPEININIVELGLIYSCDIILSNNNTYDIKITMTLTAPGCGMGPVLKSDVEQGIKGLPLVNQVDVEVVFDPPWSKDMMSEIAKLELGLI